MERKQFAFDVKEIDPGQRTFAGHASVFNTPDHGYVPDIIMPGAFRKTLKEWGPLGAKRIKVLALHRSDWLPIGVPVELTEDQTGLFFRAKLSDTQLGRDVLTLLRDGVLTEMSIGYDCVKHEMDRQRNVRLLHEVRLWEISPVTWAVHPQAAVIDVKHIRTATDRDLYDLALSEAQPDPSTESEAAAPAPFDPELLQSIRALTAEVKAATATRRMA